MKKLMLLFLLFPLMANGQIVYGLEETGAPLPSPDLTQIRIKENPGETGRSLAKPTKRGVYIKDGKKVLVK